jgi:hypothetical protein
MPPSGSVRPHSQESRCRELGQKVDMTTSLGMRNVRYGWFRQNRDNGSYGCFPTSRESALASASGR